MSEAPSLLRGADRVILRLARALARKAAREDHARQQALSDEEISDPRPVLDASPGRALDR